jgi:hypothetical protein
MRLRQAIPGAVLVLSGCSSGEETPTPPPGDGGADVDHELDADAAAEPAPCEPYGTWTVSYTADAGSPPTTETLLVAPDPDAGGISVTFADRQPPVDTCSIPDAGNGATWSAAGTLDPATCTLTATYDASWCMSGEQQCDAFTLTLALAGSMGSGTAHEHGGWCMDQHDRDFGATATKSD